MHPTEDSDNLSREELRLALRAAILRVEADWMEGNDAPSSSFVHTILILYVWLDASITKDCSGSTLAVVVIKDNLMLVANVGDSEVLSFFMYSLCNPTCVANTDNT